MDKFYDYLKEMALGQAYYHPDLELKLMQIVKVNKQFAEVMQRLPGITFNIMFVPSDFKYNVKSGKNKSASPDPYGNNDPEQEVRFIAKKLNMNTSNCITCVVTERFSKKFDTNSIATIVPASAWGRIHRMCHGLLREGGNMPAEYQRTRNDLYIRIKEFFRECRLEKIPMNGFQFKSFKTNTPTNKTGINDESEFYREVLTEYIWHGGRIRYQPTQENPQPELEAIKKLQTILHEGLQELVGQIIWCDGN